LFFDQLPKNAYALNLTNKLCLYSPPSNSKNGNTIVSVDAAYNWQPSLTPLQQSGQEDAIQTNKFWNLYNLDKVYNLYKGYNYIYIRKEHVFQTLSGFPLPIMSTHNNAQRQPSMITKLPTSEEAISNLISFWKIN
jgi:hypothetical protein